MFNVKRALAGVIVPAVAAVGFGASHATIAHASCTGAGSWTDTTQTEPYGSVSGGLADHLWEVSEKLSYEEQDDGAGFCEIQYRAVQTLYHWNGSSYVVDSNDSGFNGNYATIRIWRCGSLYAQNGPVLVGSYGSGASGSTGYFYSGWISGYHQNGQQCGPQIDNGVQDGFYPALTDGSYASDSDIANGLGHGLTTYFGYEPYLNF